MPEISIIVPVYNVAKYMRKCVDSILCQTFSDIEVILVDDGSSDGSQNICDEYGNRDSRVKVIHKKNGGLSSARNVGIKEARGRFLGFIDSDDYISCDMFQLLYNNIISENADISICGIYHCYEGKKPKENSPWRKVLKASEAISIAFEGKIFSVNAVNKLYKKNLFDNIRYPEGKTTEDAFVIVDLFSKCNIIVATSEQKYFYYHREGSITTIKTAANCFDCIEAYKRNYKIIMDKFPELKQIAMSNLCWSYFYALDRIMLAEDREIYCEKEKEIIDFLKSKILFVIFKSRLANIRKIASFVLLINRNLYKKLLLYNTKKNVHPNV